MPGTLVALISRCDRASALARIDIAAVEVMTEGRAATLSEARIDIIRTRLSRQHAELVALIEELAARPSSGNGRVAALNADLGVKAHKALAQVELFIRQAEFCARRNDRGARWRPGTHNEGLGGTSITGSTDIPGDGAMIGSSTMRSAPALANRTRDDDPPLSPCGPDRVGRDDCR